MFTLMHKFCTVAAVTVVLMAVAAGCRSPSPGPESFLRLGQENAASAKARLDSYKHIFLACIYEDSWRDQGPREYSWYRFKGTVVRTYKGDWRTSERIRFVHGIDSPVTPDFKSNAGKLVFLFTNQHTDAEIAFEADGFLYYNPELERVIEYLFPNRRNRESMNISPRWANQAAGGNARDRRSSARSNRSFGAGLPGMPQLGRYADASAREKPPRGGMFIGNNPQ